mmetsp:Transcript_31057/g.99327  ORF Transcript_31057/g.99327 Transcript_31057/m.99327 type:complete len:202 (+) Transcript_31057:185-790(+)
MSPTPGSSHLNPHCAVGLLSSCSSSSAASCSAASSASSASPSSSASASSSAASSSPPPAPPLVLARLARWASVRALSASRNAARQTSSCSTRSSNSSSLSALSTSCPVTVERFASLLMSLAMVVSIRMKIDVDLLNAARASLCSITPSGSFDLMSRCTTAFGSAMLDGSGATAPLSAGRLPSVVCWPPLPAAALPSAGDAC